MNKNLSFQILNTFWPKPLIIVQQDYPTKTQKHTYSKYQKEQNFTP